MKGEDSGQGGAINCASTMVDLVFKRGWHKIEKGGINECKIRRLKKRNTRKKWIKPKTRKFKGQKRKARKRTIL